MTNLTIHHLNISRSTRILWLAEELGLDYTLVKHERDATFRAPDSLKSVHPLGKAPTVEVDGRTMVESGAIIDYLIERFGNGRLAPQADERADYLEMMHFVEGSMAMPVILRLLAPRFGLPEPVVASMDAQIGHQLDFLENWMADRDHVLRSGFSGADIQLEYMLEHAETLGQLSQLPRLAAYLERLQARPAYQKAIALGGPVTVARKG